jgi:ribonuclease E
MSAKKTRTDRAADRAADRLSLQDMLTNPTPVNNISAVGAAQVQEPVVAQPQVTEEPAPQPVLVAQTEIAQAEEVVPAPVAAPQPTPVQPQQVAEPAPVAQVVEPAPTQPQPVQEAAPVSDAPQNPMAAMAAMLTGMMETGGLNPEFLKECNVSTPLDPRRAQLLKLAGMFTKKSQKAIMTEALDMWLTSHGFIQPPQ